MGKFFVSCILSISIFSSVIFAQPAESPWLVFNGDNRHTGVSQYDLGKDKKELLWRYKTGGSVESSSIYFSLQIIIDKQERQRVRQ